MRETSSRSSISCACRRALRSITSSACATSPGATCSLRSIVVQPRIGVSGERSSCDSVARNWSLSSLSRSAALRASCSRTSSQAGLLGDLAEGDVAREHVDEALLPEGGGGPRQPAVAAVGVAVAVLEARGRRALHELAQLRRASARGRRGAGSRRPAARSSSSCAKPRLRSQLAFSWSRRPSRSAIAEQVRGQREEAVAPRLEVEPVGGLGEALGVLALLAQPPPLRLLANVLAPPEELDEHRDLRPQHLGLDRELDVVDRPQRVAACHAGLELAHRGHEDDRRLLGAGPPADQAGGLEAVELRHVDVEQDHRELVAQERAQRLVPGARGRHL